MLLQSIFQCCLLIQFSTIGRLVDLIQPLVDFHNASYLSYLSVVRYMENLAFPWYFLCLIVFKYLYILQIFSVAYPLVAPCFLYFWMLWISFKIVSLFLSGFSELWFRCEEFTSAGLISSFVHLIMITAYLMTGVHIYGVDFFPLKLLSPHLGYHVTAGYQGTSYMSWSQVHPISH